MSGAGGAEQRSDGRSWRCDAPEMKSHDGREKLSSAARLAPHGTRELKLYFTLQEKRPSSPPRERLRRTSPQVALLPRTPAELVDGPRTLLVPLGLGDPMGAKTMWQISKVPHEIATPTADVGQRGARTHQNDSIPFMMSARTAPPRKTMCLRLGGSSMRILNFCSRARWKKVSKVSKRSSDARHHCDKLKYSRSASRDRRAAPC